jgi:hypothetical protein
MNQANPHQTITSYIINIHVILFNHLCLVGSEVLKAMVMKNTILLDIPPCSPLKVNRRLGGTRRPHLQGRRINQARNRREAGSKQSDMFLRNV